MKDVGVSGFACDMRTGEVTKAQAWEKPLATAVSFY